MGRQDSDPAAAIVGPSIALLQERFKKLERIKEKREEERQLIMFSSSSEAKRIIPTNYNNYNSFSDDQLFLPYSRPAAFHQDPLSLGLNLNNMHADYHRALKISSNSSSTQPSLSSLWSAHHEKRAVKTPQKFDISDVDTSLHL